MTTAYLPTWSSGMRMSSSCPAWLPRGGRVLPSTFMVISFSQCATCSAVPVIHTCHNSREDAFLKKGKRQISKKGPMSLLLQWYPCALDRWRGGCVGAVRYSYSHPTLGMRRQTAPNLCIRICVQNATIHSGKRKREREEERGEWGQLCLPESASSRSVDPGLQSCAISTCAPERVWICLMVEPCLPMMLPTLSVGTKSTFSTLSAVSGVDAVTGICVAALARSAVYGRPGQAHYGLADSVFVLYCECTGKRCAVEPRKPHAPLITRCRRIGNTWT